MEYNVGEVIEGQFKVLSVKEGGMGIVYICKDLKNSNSLPYALKGVHPKWLNNKSLVNIFLDECFIHLELGNLANVISAKDILILNEQPFLLMDSGFGNTNSLRAYINTSITDEMTNLDIAIEIAKGMKFVNLVNPKLVHSDLTPENILIEQMMTAGQGKTWINNRVYITDFGLACFEDNSSFSALPIGKMPYLSPEKCNRLNSDIRSDIYSFGVIMYELFFHLHPYQGKIKNELDFLNAHLNFKPTPPSELGITINEEIYKIICKCLEKKPEQRFQDFIELYNKLVYLRIELGFQDIKIKSQLHSITKSKLEVNFKEVMATKEISIIFNSLSQGVNPEILGGVPDWMRREIKVKRFLVDLKLNRELDVVQFESLFNNIHYKKYKLSLISSIVDVELYEKAIGYLNDFLKENDGSCKVFYLLGYCYHGKGVPEKALFHYEKALQYEETNDVNISLVMVHISRIYATENNFRKAEEYLLKAIEIDNFQIYAYLNLGFLYFQTGRKEEGLLYYQSAFRIDSKLSIREIEKVNKRLGLTIEKNEIEKNLSDHKIRKKNYFASSVVNDSQELGRTNQIESLSKEDELMQEGKFEELITRLLYQVDLMKEIDKNEFSLTEEHVTTFLKDRYIKLSNCYRYIGKYDEAIKYTRYYIDLIETTKNKIQPLLSLMDLYRLDKKFDNAFETLTLIESTLNTYGGVDEFICESFNTISNVYRDLKKYEQALCLGKKAVDNLKQLINYPKERLAVFLNNVGLTYCRLNKHEVAIDYYNQANSIFYSQTDYRSKINIAFTFANLAFSYNVLNKKKISLSYALSALNIRKEMLGENHPDLIYTLELINWIKNEK